MVAYRSRKAAVIDCAGITPATSVTSTKLNSNLPKTNVTHLLDKTAVLRVTLELILNTELWHSCNKYSLNLLDRLEDPTATNPVR
jgi:hypothetical protein